MKYLLSLFVFSLIIYDLHAQNNVSNGSFEQNIGCPVTIASADSLVNNWDAVDISSVEYFHVCGVQPSVRVPSNMLGYQYAANGSAYIGQFSYVYNNTDFREYFHSQITPLTKDSFYRVSMSVSLANAYLPTNGIGTFFYDSGYSSSTIYAMTSNTPQVSYLRYGTVRDTQDWVRLVGYMPADSMYDNIIIGCFEDDNTIKIDTQYNVGQTASYYYYDSIVVERAPNINIEFYDSLLCSGDTLYIPIFVNPIYFNNNTVFTVELSDSTGSFSSPIVIGSSQISFFDSVIAVLPSNIPTSKLYRIRVKANLPAYISPDNGINLQIGNVKPLKPSVISNLPVCEGDSIILYSTSINNGIKWYWFNEREKLISTNDSVIILNSDLKQKEWYKVHSSLNGCLSDPDSVYLSIKEKRHPMGKLYVSPHYIAKSGTELTFIIKDTMYLGMTPGYTWLLNNNVISGVTDTFYKFVMGTTINTGDEVCIKLSSNYQCRLSDTLKRCISNIENLHIKAFKNSDGNLVYPNPASTMIYINTKDATHIHIFDINGKVVLDHIIKENENNVDVTDIKPGIYIIELLMRDGYSAYIRLVKR